MINIQTVNKSEKFRAVENIYYFCVLMKKAIFKITSFLLAILVLFSTVSLTVEKHFCGNFLVDTALFSVADSCGMSVELEQSVKK